MNFIKVLILIVCFALFVPIGTLTHEYGHVLTAKLLGYNTEIHFSSMEVLDKEDNDFHSFLITLGGPLQTIITGTVGFFLILNRRKTNRYNDLNLIDWSFIFLSFFWLRQIFNPILSIVMEIINPDGKYFGGDEPWLSEYLGLNRGTLPILFAIVGGGVFFYIYLKIIPKRSRFELVMSCFLGSLIGFFGWMKIIGPVLLP